METVAFVTFCIQKICEAVLSFCVLLCSFLSDITLMNVCLLITFVSCWDTLGAIKFFFLGHSTFEKVPSSWTIIDPIAGLLVVFPPLRAPSIPLRSAAGIVYEKMLDCVFNVAYFVFLSRSLSFCIEAPELAMNLLARLDSYS